MIRLAVRAGADLADVVLAELVQLAPNGVEEDSGPGWVEYAIYGAEGELPDLGSVEALAGDGMVEVTSERVPDDWADRWRDFHEPSVMAGGRVVIRPSWRERVEGDAAPDVDVVIDPGQAFGTGAHPTTRMCVGLLVELADEGRAAGSLADLGTGSAVLAIVAAKLGWTEVIGIDHEQAAIEAAAANAKANGAKVRFERRNLRSEAPPEADTVVANLTAPLLVEVARGLTRPPAVLVCSGLLEREANGVARSFEARGLRLIDRRDSGDWSALRLEFDSDDRN